MYSYLCYSLTIRASLPLPELISLDGEGHADVVIREGKLPVTPPEDSENGQYPGESPGEAFLAWPDVGRFVVRGGREIIFERDGGPEESWLRHCILGPVLGVLLHQRGLLVFHGSAVEINDHAFAFLGWKGRGKSTTAAGLRLRGYNLFADDTVAVDMTDPERPFVVPGVPQFKLWPDAAEALKIDPSELLLLHSRLEKRAGRVSAASAQRPRPLKGLYILDQGERPHIESLPFMEAFAEVIRNVYAARFIGKDGIPPWHFHQCITLTRATGVHRFRRKLSLESLPEALDMLEAHTQEQTLVPVQSR